MVCEKNLNVIFSIFLPICIKVSITYFRNVNSITECDTYSYLPTCTDCHYNIIHYFVQIVYTTCTDFTRNF